ncbi:LacI family DNA-binding transcriptional regulator [Seonamhaeicola maritimus]|uniref:LacI family transcriptional regulator n=1 Tax=Seonamhaeicola maritimus TaxID=2591822 RepID=A0A5C7GGV2_9FLAO|nr:LacI family DNA-binding transcriptional regulator [Seonamhaeicola maritimus]TXG36106.1 LacI family transcriptional regulator [Seonamhaeicola maritimus]
MKHVTIKDVAKRLNVSVSTVSRAFNDKYDIRKDTKELILKTAKEMGYHPNPIAKKLSQNRSLNIGVVIPEIINEYYSEVIIALQEFLIYKGYQVLVMQSDENGEQELKNVKTLINNMVDGLIIAPTTGNSNMDFYRQRINDGYPIVFLNRVDDSAPGSKVIFNNEKWSFFATEHLIRQNLNKIYHFSGYLDMCVSQERIQGFKKAMNKHKISKENYKIIEAGLLPEEGMEVIEDLIFHHDIPDAIFCVNDMVALGAIKKLKDNGYRVPEDVAVVGFTETRMAELVSPQLSSVKQPTYDMAKKAGELLLRHIEDENAPAETIIMNGEFTIRKSSVKNSSAGYL